MVVPSKDDTIEVKYTSENGSSETVVLDVLFVDDNPEDIEFRDADYDKKDAILVVQGEKSNPRKNEVGEPVEEDTYPFEILFSDDSSIITQAKEETFVDEEFIGSEVDISIS
jgi:hypothetical protein